MFTILLTIVFLLNIAAVVSLFRYAIHIFKLNGVVFPSLDDISKAANYSINR